MIQIENIQGSEWHDVLVGNQEDNLLTGMGGLDTIIMGEDDLDSLIFSQLNDSLLMWRNEGSQVLLQDWLKGNRNYTVRPRPPC